MLNGCKEEAMNILSQVHGVVDAKLEMQEIEKSLHGEKGLPFRAIFRKGLLPVVLIGTALSGLQQFTGINAVLYYGADIFEKALGFGQEDVLQQQILLAGVNFAFTFLAMYTVDKWGRKPLIITGSVGMLMGFMMLAVSLMTQQIGLASLLGILIFIGSFAMSMGPIVWVLLSEMFPNSIRSAAMSVAVAVQWAMNYVVSQSFPIIMGSEANQSPVWNGSLPYFLFMGFIVLTIILTVKYIPETKGKSLEDLEKIWEDRYGSPAKE
jgi:SP family xylose:H+ symportor-like MFS transporter